MTQADDTAAKSATARARGRSFVSWKIIAILLVLIVGIGGGAGYWYLIGEREAIHAKLPEPEAPLPFYLEIKPLVVSMTNTAGTPHFVQMGLNLTLSGAAAGNVVTALLPEVQDAIRQTMLAFKVEDIVTPAGVDKMREAIIASANRVLLQRLGAERVNRLNGSTANSGIIQNIYFTTLIVE
jgi:flagellar FliL protein